MYCVHVCPGRNRRDVRLITPATEASVMFSTSLSDDVTSVSSYVRAHARHDPFETYVHHVILFHF